MHFTPLVVLLGIFVSHGIVNAETVDDVLPDLNFFEEELGRTTQQEEDQKADEELEAADALFPVVQGEEVNEETEEETEGEYVEVRVDGIPVTLRDVPRTEWFASFVDDIAKLEIVSGYKDSRGIPTGRFGPANNVTIEQLAKIAVESAKIFAPDCTGTLKNKAALGTWSEDYILCAEQLGWSVFSDGSVGIMKYATRSQVVVTILQAFEADFYTSVDQVFTDVGSSVEFSPAINRAADDGIVSGYTDSEGSLTGVFGPFDPVTRAEIAKIVSLALKIYQTH